MFVLKKQLCLYLNLLINPYKIKTYIYKYIDFKVCGLNFLNLYSTSYWRNTKHG